MSAAVAITDSICRTVLYLAGIGALMKTAPLFLPRMQVSATKQPPQPAVPPVAEAGVNGQQAQELRQ